MAVAPGVSLDYWRSLTKRYRKERDMNTVKPACNGHPRD